MKFEGVYTALITPTTTAGAIDLKGLRSNIQMQLAANVDGLVVLGTTGEAPTLSADEQTAVIEACMQEVNGKLPVIIGCGTYSTATTLANVKKAAAMGAAAALVVTPYYNCPTQEGLYQHFKAITQQTELPIIIYNVPKRCGRALQIETLKRLMHEPTIVSIKEASGDITHIQAAITQAARHPGITVLSGDDGLTLPLMSLGGHGVISVVSNLVPEWVISQVKALQRNDHAEALKWHNKLLPIIEAAFIETNPIPIKAMMEMAGLAGGPCRLPLCPLSTFNHAKVRAILGEAGCLPRGDYATQR